MSRVKKMIQREIPDEEFEKIIMQELDSSRIQEQIYLGVYTLNNDTIKQLSDEEEYIVSPHNSFRDSEEMFEKQYYTTEEKEILVEQNIGLINKCISKYEPSSDTERRFYCKEDVIEACQWGFLKACNEYPRNESTAKFTTYAYGIMENECRDMIRIAKAKKRGLGITDSLDAPIKGGKEDDDSLTVGDTVGHNENNEETDKSNEVLMMKQLIQSTFEGMDGESVLILSYAFGIGEAEYPHTELEIAQLLNLQRSKVVKKIEAAKEKFKISLYERGLLSSAESILVDEMGYSRNQINEKMENANRIYRESLDL